MRDIARLSQLASLRAKLNARRGFYLSENTQAHGDVALYISRQILASGLTQGEKIRLSSRIGERCNIDLPPQIQNHDQLELRRPDVESYEAMQGVNDEIRAGLLSTQPQTWAPQHVSTQTQWGGQTEDFEPANHTAPTQQYLAGDEGYSIQHYPLSHMSHIEPALYSADGPMPHVYGWSPYLQAIPSVLDSSGFGSHITTLGGWAWRQQQ